MRQPLQRRQEWIRGRREKRKLARQARLRRQVLRYTALAAVAVLCVVSFTHLPWSLASAQSDIEIRGNYVVSDEQVREALAPYVGKPLYRLDPQVLEKKVGSLPAVNRALVRRYLLPRPHLVVEVMEEFPWASLVNKPDAPIEYVIAETGRMIPTSQFPAIERPSLRICAPTEFTMSAKQIAQWDSWVSFIGSQTGNPVHEIDLRKPTAIEVKSGDLQLRIGAADSTLTRRLGRLASVVTVLPTMKEQVEYIDLSLENNIPIKIDKYKKRSTQPPAIATPATSTVPLL